MKKDDALDFMREKFKQWSDGEVLNEVRYWLEKNYKRISTLFTDKSLRDFVLEPFQGVLNNPSTGIDPSVYTIITQVALVNAVLAGLPGKMGVGVFICMGLEAWMAYRIARYVGIKIDKPADVLDYLGIIAGTILAVGWGFSALLNVVFSVVSLFPAAVPVTVITQLVVTDIFGVIALVAFGEVKEGRSFKVPLRLWKELIKQTRGLLKHHYDLVKNLLDPDTIKQTGLRAWTYLKGDVPINAKSVNGEVFATVAMMYLVTGKYSALEGPLSETFLNAIRLRWSSQLDPHADISEIAELFRDYDAEALAGAANVVKGKMFELMVEDQENRDGDAWSAKLHSDESYPGTDILFSNELTGDTVEVSLKAVSSENSQLIESAIRRYPDSPIVTTDEVAALFENVEMIAPSGIKYSDLSEMTAEMIDELISGVQPISSAEVAVGGVAVGTVAALWPFVMAYLRGHITQDQLTKLFERVLGDAGVSLASRVSYGLVLGPIFAWYLLARGVMGVVAMAEPEGGATYYVSYEVKR